MYLSTTVLLNLEKISRRNEGPIHLAFLLVLTFSGMVPKASRNYIFTVLRPLVDVRSRFGAHWILKTPQNNYLEKKIERKLGTRQGFEKQLMLN